jgi:hypothetical protein
MAARAVLAVIAVATVIGLTACASATPGRTTAGSTAHKASAGAGHTASAGASASQQPTATGQASAGASLCANDRGVDRVVVSRGASPHEVTLRGETQVRALATALCALPPMATGQPCLAATGGSVRLVFAAGEQGFPPVSVQESGCRSVTGIGPTRSWSASSPFGQLLSEAVGGVGRLVPGTHPSSVPTGP